MAGEWEMALKCGRLAGLGVSTGCHEIPHRAHRVHRAEI